MLSFNGNRLALAAAFVLIIGASVSMAPIKMWLGWFDYNDKWGHAALYAIFAYLVCSSTTPPRSIGFAIRAALLSSLVLTFASETLQLFCPGRHGWDTGDLLANVAGSVGGTAAFLVIRPRLAEPAVQKPSPATSTAREK